MSFKLVEGPLTARGRKDPICRRGGLLKWVVQRVSAYVASGVPVDPGTDRRWAKQRFPNHNPAKLKTEADERENNIPKPDATRRGNCHSRGNLSGVLRQTL
jgi:hypothetical protein